MLTKKRRRRMDNEVNAGSMADIAFLLLIFFLVTTTILIDKGIMVKLPPWEKDPIRQPLPEHNVLSVKLNKAGALLVEGEYAEIEILKEITKHFILNPNNDPALSTSPKMAVVSLQNDRGTSYEKYIEVYNELRAAYNELWEDKAKTTFGKSYADINNRQQKQVREEIPLVISEAEPTEYVSSNL